MFVAVGENFKIISSSNGVRWTSRTTDVIANLNGVTYGNGYFVVVGDEGTFLISGDAIVWNNQSDPTGTILRPQ